MADNDTGHIVWDGDGREEAIVNHIINGPDSGSLRGNPSAIVSEIDAWTTKNGMTMMTVGTENNRGGRVVDLIAQSKPKVIVEIGGYIGYSAMLFGGALRNAGGYKYVSLEMEEHYAACAKKLVEFAGLSDVVEILVGTQFGILEDVVNPESAIGCGVLFINHENEFYLADLRLAEQLGFVKAGSYVVADNVGRPKGKDYVDTMEKDKSYDNKMSYFKLVRGVDDGLMVSQKLK